MILCEYDLSSLGESCRFKKRDFWGPMYGTHEKSEYFLCSHKGSGSITAKWVTYRKTSIVAGYIFRAAFGSSPGIDGGIEKILRFNNCRLKYRLVIWQSHWHKNSIFMGSWAYLQTKVSGMRSFKKPKSVLHSLNESYMRIYDIHLYIQAMSVQ